MTLRRRGGPEPEKPARSPGPGWEAGGACPDAAFPRCYPVSNGVYHLTLASSGLASACAGGIGIYRGPDDPLTGPAGLRIYFETPEGRTDLLPLPGAAGGLSFSHAFRGGALSFEGESDALHSLCSAAVSARDLCEVRFVELKSPRALEGRLCLEFEPMLARLRDWEGHPAYWRLGLHAEVREGALLIRRLPRGEVRECWLCLRSNRPLDCRADALGEPLGWLSHPFVRASTPAFAPMSGSFSARFALAFGPTAEEAMAAASRGLNAAAQDFADLLSARAALGGMGARELSAALDMAGWSFRAIPGPRPGIPSGASASPATCPSSAPCWRTKTSCAPRASSYAGRTCCASAACGATSSSSPARAGTTSAASPAPWRSCCKGTAWRPCWARPAGSTRPPAPARRTS